MNFWLYSYQKYIYLIMLGCLFAIPQQTSGQSKAVTQMQSDTLSVLCWNIYMLPSPFVFTDRMERTEGIIELLSASDYDVIILQETFYLPSFKKLSTGLKETYPYQLEADIPRGLIRSNSGNWIISKYPIEHLATVAFKDCIGADCLAKKGAVLCAIEKDGNPYQVLGTHLQSGRTSERDIIRSEQRRHIFHLLQKHKQRGVPQIVAGDFNTDRFEPENYQMMLDELHVDDSYIPMTPTSPAVSFVRENSRKSILDYVWIKPNQVSYSVISYQIEDFVHWKSGIALADHAAVSCKIITYR